MRTSPYVDSLPDRHIASVRLVLTSINGVACSQDGNYKIQRAWDSVIITRNFNLVAEQALTVIDKSQLVAVTSPHIATGYMLYLSLGAASASIMRQTESRWV